ncbi:MAG: hypothetical protein AAF639_06640 [Chloroflexota bacterium]
MSQETTETSVLHGTHDDLQKRSMRTAYWISQIGSPPILSMVGILLSATILGTLGAWLWATLYTMVAVIAPTLYVVWLAKTGRVTDIHLPLREERTLPMIFTLFAGLFAWFVLAIGNAPQLLLLIAAINGIQSIIFLFITLRWKISFHCTMAAQLSVLSLLLFGWNIGTPVVFSVPLIAWARVHLQRHTIAQTVAGSVLGVALVVSGLYVTETFDLELFHKLF